jgi:hypothetical protein
MAALYPDVVFRSHYAVMLFAQVLQALHRHLLALLLQLQAAALALALIHAVM